jgi:hypothetical protein
MVGLGGNADWRGSSFAKKSWWMSDHQWHVVSVLTFHARLLPATLMESVGPENKRPEIVIFLSLARVFPDVKRPS